MASTVLINTELPLTIFVKGKVRDTYDLGNELLIIATDRISAFDVVLPVGIPDKGKVLNQLSAYWFDKTKDIIPNHVVETLTSVQSLDKYLTDLKPGGVLLVDADLVLEVPVEGAVALPFTRLAREAGREMMANIVALGALAAVTQAVSAAGLKSAVLARVPPQTRELNETALEAGMAAGRKYLADKPPKGLEETVGLPPEGEA